MISRLLSVLVLSASHFALAQENFGSKSDFEMDEVDSAEDADLFGPANENINANSGLNSATPRDKVDEVDPGEGGQQYQQQQYQNQQKQNGGQQYQQQQYQNQQYQKQNGGQQASPNQYSAPQQVVPNQAPVQQIAPLQQTPPIQQVVPAQQVLPVQQAAPVVPINETLPPVEDTLPPASVSLPPPAANDFAGAPPLPGTLRIMADGEAPEEYVVESGDNLHDICDQLLDEPGYWPKLWSLNPEIKNPHFVFPGMKLRFYPGDERTPPFMQIVSEEDIIPIDKGDIIEKQLIAEQVAEAPVTDVEPQELTEVVGPENIELPSELSDLIEVGGRVYSGSGSSVVLPGFIFAKEVSASGIVVGGREGEVSAKIGQTVYVKKTGGVEAGQRYTVLRPLGEVRKKESGAVVGTRYLFGAHIRIERDLEGGVAAASITDNYDSVRPGDLVVDYLSTVRQVSSMEVDGPVTNADVEVVAMAEPMQSIAGSGQVVFLDKGGGLSQGSLIALNSHSGHVTLSLVTEVPKDPVPTAVVRVIDVTDAGAAAIVVSAQQEVRIGDRGGKG